MEIFEVIGIFSELKDSVHNVRRQAIQVFLNLIFRPFFVRVFQIQILTFAV